MFMLTLKVGMMVMANHPLATREAAETRGNEWMVEQRSIVDAEVASGNVISAEIPFSFTINE